MQQADRLLAPCSCELPAVDDDLGSGVGKKLTCTTGKLFKRKVKRARNMRLDVRRFG